MIIVSNGLFTVDWFFSCADHLHTEHVQTAAPPKKIISYIVSRLTILPLAVTPPVANFAPSFHPRELIPPLSPLDVQNPHTV